MNNALDKFGKIFVESYSENDEKNGITIIDKESANIERRIDFKNNFTSASRELIEYNDKLVTYGNNSLNNSCNKEGQSAIGVLDCETYEIIEYLFKDEKIIFSYVYKNNIYVITAGNSVYKFDDKLKLMGKKVITERNFIDNYFNDDYNISKIIHKDKRISVLYTSRKFETENLGFIAEYSCDDIGLLNKFNITLKGEKTWLGEVVDFVKLN